MVQVGDETEKVMSTPIQVELRSEDVIRAVKKMSKEDRDAFLEDLLAATSEVYLESIKEARADYKAGRLGPHDEAFGV